MAHVSKQVMTPPGNAGGAGGGGGGGGSFGGGGGLARRGPQSVQSVPYWQSGYSAPGPPSSHQPSEAYTHVSPQSTTLGG